MSRSAIVCRKAANGDLLAVSPPESLDAAAIRKSEDRPLPAEGIAEIYVLIPLREYQHSSLAGPRPRITVK